ncbi:MAG: helix-turn-helix domain-containing protein [Neomegalonema sp.]|nr:helix-turn-helix domain-containing protein [Neomegalonema sp.]
MTKRERARLFRERLKSAIAEAGLSAAALARRAELDRSALSQLLKDDAAALPNGDSLARLALALEVSADWLLGLSAEPGSAARILEQAVQVAPAVMHPVDRDILAWHHEALGQKIRYAPASLPTPLKTEAVMAFEFRHFALKNADQAIAEAERQLSELRRPESDMEIVMSTQSLADFAFGASIWTGLPAAERKAQLIAIAEATESLYPGLRLHLFDGRRYYTAAFTVFGHQRAILYIGQRYLVFTRGERVLTMIRHFDELVRAAGALPDRSWEWIRDLAKRI